MYASVQITPAKLASRLPRTRFKGLWLSEMLRNSPEVKVLAVSLTKVELGVDLACGCRVHISRARQIHFSFHANNRYITIGF
jgi:hypothetical protein